MKGFLRVAKLSGLLPQPLNRALMPSAPPAELADYRLPDGSLTQDSVMALGFAVTHAYEAHASGGRIHARLFSELNDLLGRPPQWWLDRRKFGDPAAGLIPGHRAPDEAHGGVRHRYRAEVEQVPGLLAEGWTPDDPAILDELGLRPPSG